MVCAALFLEGERNEGSFPHRAKEGIVTQQQMPPPPPGVPPPVGPQLPKGQAIAAMVCGIISVVLCWLPIAPMVLGILGIALGAIGMKKAGAGVAGGKGLAITGLICGIVGTVWGTFYTIYWFIVGAALFSMGF